MSRLRLALAATALAVGLVWLGQGLGLIPGSFMTGRREWAVAGVVLVAVAAWLFWSGRGRAG